LLLFPLLSICSCVVFTILITNCYALKRNLFNDVIRSFVMENLADYNYLLPANLLPSVNA
ncbi:hypothetical protein FEV09_22615, partial [Pseudanabaena catenata USMAC16]|nr:hypothetical protein [Pseudanabaena catenata USMAC16]